MSKVSSEKKARQRSRWSEAQMAAYREKARRRRKANYSPKKKVVSSPPTPPCLPPSCPPPSKCHIPPPAPPPSTPPVFAKKSLPTPPVLAKKSLPTHQMFPKKPNFAKYLVRKWSHSLCLTQGNKLSTAWTRGLSWGWRGNLLFFILGPN